MADDVSTVTAVRKTFEAKRRTARGPVMRIAAFGVIAPIVAATLTGCGGDDGSGTSASATTTSSRIVEEADGTTLVEELERICAAGAALDDIASVVAMVSSELEALEVDRTDRVVLAQLTETFDAAQLALDQGQAEEAAGHVERASAIVRDAGGECGGPPRSSPLDLVEPDAVIDIGGAIGQVTAAGDDVWVTEFDGRTLTRVHGPSGEILARIPVDDDELRTIQVTSDGVWVRGATALHRVDPSTNEVVATVRKDQIGANVTRAFVDDAAIWACDGTRLVRAGLEDGQPTGAVELDFPCGTVTSGDGQLWVTSDAGPGRWARIDPVTLALVLAVDVPVDLATFPAIGGGEVWSHGQSDAADPGFAALDADSGAVLHQGSLDAGGGPGALTETTYFAAVADTGVVVGIDRTSGEIVVRLDGGVDPNAVSVSGGSLWVVDDETGQLRRFSP